MDVLRVEAALLRATLPDLTLRPGMTLPGRVLERAGQFGVLLLAGAALTAELPDNLQAGATMRLRVEEIGADRIVLRALEPPPVAAPPPDVAVPLPGGRQAEVRVTERPGPGGEGDEPTTIALAYESPALGRVDLKLVHRPGAGMQVTVGIFAGAPEDAARASADELRDALTAAAGVPAVVTVVGRPPEPRVDLYA